MTFVLNGFMFVRAAFAVLLMLSMTVFLPGCLALRPSPEVKYSGGVVGSLSSSVSLAYTSPERSISGSGYLLYRKPDQMRVVILSPFGSVLQEINVSGELVTIIDAGNGIAFNGAQKDLPDKGDFSGWRYINWLIDIDPPDPSKNNVTIERTNRFGQPEKAVFENGLLISKTTASVGHVRYGNYASVQGSALPLEITLETAALEKFTILLEDPEINIPVADGAFSPDLSKLRVYPLSALK